MVLSVRTTRVHLHCASRFTKLRLTFEYFSVDKGEHGLRFPFACRIQGNVYGIEGTGSASLCYISPDRQLGCCEEAQFCIVGIRDYLARLSASLRRAHDLLTAVRRSPQTRNKDKSKQSSQMVGPSTAFSERKARERNKRKKKEASDSVTKYRGKKNGKASFAERMPPGEMQK